jgi:hypothetical protein
LTDVEWKERRSEMLIEKHLHEDEARGGGGGGGKKEQFSGGIAFNPP